MIPNYDMIIKAVSVLYESNNSPSPEYPIDSCTATDALRKSLNRAFPDFICSDVIYTKNFDKKFFGIMVIPCGENDAYIMDKMLAGLSMENKDVEFEPFKFPKYILEIDGRLIRDFRLTYAELTALIIQEICAMNSSEPTRKLRNAIDNYICLNDIHINKQSIEHNLSIFHLVVQITLHNITSLFTKFGFSKYDDECTVVRDGRLHGDFLSAYDKLLSSANVETVNTNMVLLSWFFENYEKFDKSRYLEIMLRDSMKYEASACLKRIIKACLMQITGGLNFHDSRYYDEVISESTKRKGLIYQMKRNGLKSIEEDLFEYNMRLRNVETQDDAILLMRQINSRMSILEEYLETEDLDEKDKERWTACYKKYLELREALSKKTVYNKKMYGLFVDYNALSQMNDNGNFMNTYY